MEKKVYLAEVQRLQKIAGLSKINEDRDWNWTSTRTDQPSNQIQNRPENPVKSSSDGINNLPVDILQNRLYNTKLGVLYQGKYYFLEYDKRKKDYEEKGRKYDSQSLRDDLIRSIKNHIQEYFFDKLKRKYNISLPNSEQYLQQIPPVVDKIVSELPNDPTPEQVAEQYRHFRSEINQMFKRYEKLGK